MRFTFPESIYLQKQLQQIQWISMKHGIPVDEIVKLGFPLLFLTILNKEQILSYIKIYDFLKEHPQHKFKITLDTDVNEDAFISKDIVDKHVANSFNKENIKDKKMVLTNEYLNNLFNKSKNDINNTITVETQSISEEELRQKEIEDREYQKLVDELDLAGKDNSEYNNRINAVNANTNLFNIQYLEAMTKEIDEYKRQKETKSMKITNALNISDVL